MTGWGFTIVVFGDYVLPGGLCWRFPDEIPLGFIGIRLGNLGFVLFLDASPEIADAAP